MRDLITALADAQRHERERSTRPVMIGLFEAGAGLSRIWRHFMSSPRVQSVGIISAMRDAGNPERKQQNDVLTRNLSRDIRGLGLGYIPAVGRWVENEGQPDERVVLEKSFIVPNISLEQIVRLGRKYRQEAVIWAAQGKVRAYDQQGHPTDWSNWKRMRFNVGSKEIATGIKGKDKRFAFAASQDQGPTYDVKGRQLTLCLESDPEAEDHWTGDWSLSELHEGDLVWWESTGYWEPARGLLEVLSTSPPQVRAAESGLPAQVFELKPHNTSWFSVALREVP